MGPTEVCVPTCAEVVLFSLVASQQKSPSSQDMVLVSEVCFCFLSIWLQLLELRVFKLYI